MNLRLHPSALYASAFLTGAIVMSFEMLGSRYLNPYFGSGIYTWSALISTVLAALAVGYFCGGWLADNYPRSRVLGATVIIGSVYLMLLPLFADRLLEAVLAMIDDIRLGSLLAALAIVFFPVVFLGMYSPFAIRLLLLSPLQSGAVSGNGLRHFDLRKHHRHAGHDVRVDACVRIARDHDRHRNCRRADGIGAGTDAVRSQVMAGVHFRRGGSGCRIADRLANTVAG
jgi:hypothetical protein